MSRFVLFSVVIAVALIVSGCWDYLDIENRAYVFGVAVDRNPDGEGYLATIEIAHPQGQPQSGSPGGQLPEPPKILKSRAGTTLGDALYHIGDGHLSQVPLWQEVKAIFISDDVAREGIGPVIDLFFRSTVLNLRSYMYIVEGSAAEPLLWLPEFQPLTSRYVREMERQFAKNPLYAKPKSVIMTASRLIEAGAVMLPRLVMENGEVRLKGSAVIQDGVWVGWLDEPTTIGANWLIGDLDRVMAQTGCPIDANHEITMELNAAEHRLDLTVDGDRIEARYRIGAIVRMLDMSGCLLNPTDLEDRILIERAAAEWMRRHLELAIKRSQEELGVDFLGINVAFSRRFPQLARQIEWNDVYPKVDIHVETEANLAHPGVLQVGPIIR